MPIAGRLQRILVSDDGGGIFVNLGGIVDATLNLNIDELEVTSHDDNGARVYIPNHHDATVDGTLRWDEDDSGQGKILDAVFDKSVFEIEFYMEVTAGRVYFTADAFATSFAPGAPLDDAATLDLTLRLSNVQKAVQAA